MTTIYALFVGINAYEENIIINQMARFPALHGCVNDVQAVHSWLEKDKSIQYKPLLLLDHEATKAEIVKAFRTHLAQAKKDDVVLFYFSGHGTVEEAPLSVWNSETDRRLECIVCHYQTNDSGKFLLADKELRFLIGELYQKTNAHITTIFDCCHSGDNTRALVSDKVVKKQIDLVFPKRKWNDFIFSDTYTPDAFKNKGIDEVMPPGAHIQLSACESNESALEVNGHGVLTSCLLETLAQTDGCISYRDLNSRMRNRIKYEFEQRPRVYTPEGSGNLADLGFLKKPVGQGLGQCQLVANLAGQVRIDRGAMHGVVANLTKVHFTIDSKPYTGTVKKVQLSDADVSIPKDALQALGDKTVRAELEGLGHRTLRVQLVNTELNTTEAARLVKALTNAENSPYIALEENPARADYSLVCAAGLFYITKPNDRFRPLVKTIKVGSPGDLDVLGRYFRHIAQWKFVDELKNAQSKLPEKTLDFEVVTVDPADANNLQPLAIPNDTATLTLDKTVDNNGDLAFKKRMQIKVTNTGKKDLYVASLYSSLDFSVNIDYLQHSKVVMLEKGQSMWLRDHKNRLITANLNETVQTFNWPDSTESIKFLFSTEDFSTDLLGMKELPPPQLITEVRRGSLDMDEDEVEERGAALSGWNVRNLFITVKNPLYDKISNAELKRRLNPEYPEAAYFTQGLYFELDNQSGKLVLRPGVGEAEKGIVRDTVIDLANAWCRFRRNERYEAMYAQFPTRPTIVSEGDSWFQHPLVNDTIDYVSRFYPVYCLSAAGDTIANYLKSGEFIKAIERQNASIFLLSGGGNDILGSNLPNFLKDDYAIAPEGEQPERFFNEKFEQALNTLMDMYKTVFSYFQSSKPSLKIVVHGYDYPTPVEPGYKKTNWIGKFFDKVGILSPIDRRKAVCYMMDRFNERLRLLAAQYPGQVYYINLRGLVPSNQWYDEIHPNDDGFQLVGMQFIKQISEITR